MSFGIGAPFVSVATLARMEALVALTELFTRLRGYHQVDEVQCRPRPHSSKVPRIRPPYNYPTLPSPWRAADASSLAPLPLPPDPNVGARIVCRSSSASERPPPIELAAPRVPGRPWRPAGSRELTTSSARITDADGGEASDSPLDVHRSELFVTLCHTSFARSAATHEVAVAGAGDTYFGKLADNNHRRVRSQLQITSSVLTKRGLAPRCCRACSTRRTGSAAT